MDQHAQTSRAFSFSRRYVEAIRARTTVQHDESTLKSLEADDASAVSATGPQQATSQVSAPGSNRLAERRGAGEQPHSRSRQGLDLGSVSAHGGDVPESLRRLRRIVKESGSDRTAFERLCRLHVGLEAMSEMMTSVRADPERGVVHRKFLEIAFEMAWIASACFYEVLDQCSRVSPPQHAANNDAAEAFAKGLAELLLRDGGNTLHVDREPIHFNEKTHQTAVDSPMGRELRPATFRVVDASGSTKRQVLVVSSRRSGIAP